MRQDLLAASDIPANLRPLFRLLDTYTAARIVSWKLYAQALREPELANQAAEYEAFRAHEAEVDKLRKAYEAEADRVSAR
jgi:hypothetical protein